MSLRPGEVFAGYTVERELGAGGMGSVYLAHHPRLPRFDALKLLRSELCTDPAFVGRFEREADTVAQLDHPNIVSVYDRGSQDGQLWISMRFIDGTNAEKALVDYPSGMPPERVVRIITKVASALDYAHKRDLLHRDVKPANILLTADPEDEEDAERVFLSDFGVAKAIGAAAERISSLTSTGSVVATLDYASPEQIRGQVLDHRSDIYALGCVLYKLLTGTVPYPGDSVAARVYGHLNNMAPPPSSLVPSLPSGFDEVVAKAVAKDAADRYPTCRAMALAARAALAGAVASPAPPTDPDEGFPTTLTPVAGTGDYRRRVQPVPPWVGSALRGTRPEQLMPDSGEHGNLLSGPPTGPHGAVGPHVTTGPPGGTTRPPGTPGTTVPPGPTVPSGTTGTSGQPGTTGTSGTSGQPGTTGTPGQPGTTGTRGTTPGPPSQPDSGPPTAGPSSSRRTVVIAASVVAVVVAAAIAAALVFRGDVGGTASLVVGTSSGPESTAVPTSSDALTEVPVGASTEASSSASGPSVVSLSVISPVPLTSSPPVPGLPHSAPLDQQVVVGSRRVDGGADLYAVDADGGEIVGRLTSGAPGQQSPVLSPDRGSVVYVQDSAITGTLRTVAVDGTGDRPLFQQRPDDCQTFFRPAWNPIDQTTLALVCVTTSGSYELNLISIEGVVQTPINTGLPVIDDVAYSPDGGTLTYWGSETADAGGGSIYLQPSDGGQPPTKITDGVGSSDSGPMFSPDGTRIVFERSIDGDGSQIVVVGADGTGLAGLTDGSANDQDPAWSPDGSRIAFRSDRPGADSSSTTQLWVMRSDGSGVTELAPADAGTADGPPAWGHR